MSDAESVPVSLLPLLYVAWADGVLTPSEIESIRSAVAQQEAMPSAAREAALQHLDPQSPPSATRYFRWVRTLRTAAADASVAERCSLAELSAALASGDGGPSSDAARRAVADVEAALGIDGRSVVCELRGDRPEASPPDDTEATFDVEALTAWLDAPHPELRARLRTLLQDPAFDYVDPSDTAAYRDRVLDWCRLLADQGLGALAFPEEHGGAGSMGRFITAFHTLAMHDLSLVVKFGVQFGLFGGSILRLGTERHHEAYLSQIGTLDLPGCFAMSELGHGSNVRDLETEAHYDPSTETFIINTPHNAARKEWIGNAARHGRLAVVFAQLHTLGDHHGVHAFLVPIRTDDGRPRPRVRIEDCGRKMGLNGVDNGRLWFDRVRIPRENLLDRFGRVAPDGTYDSPIPSPGRRFFTMLGTLIGGRISVARAGLTAAQSGLTIAVRYGNRRRQFGPKDAPEVPLLDYRTHRRRLLPPLATTYALHAALSSLTRRFVQRGPEEDLQDVEADANALKAYATWHTTDVLQTAREACGGQGYLAENRIGRLKADTDVFTTFEGDNTVLLLQVAKGLLSDFRREFRDVNVFEMIRFVAGEVATRVTEKNPVVTRKTDAAHLRDPEVQKAAFAYRADAQLHRTARALKRRIDDGMEPFDAFVDVQDRLVTLATVHAERLILDEAVAAFDAIDNPDLRSILQDVRSLFALSRMEADLDWFLEDGYVESPKARAVRREVNALCDALRPHAEGLVDAFAIPDACLAAPIATGTTPPSKGW